jgi:tryptophanase
MHKVRVVQKLNLLPVDERLRAIQKAGNNTFLLENKDIYIDMLTDSGVNAMSDRQTAAMHLADDSYAGSQTFARLKVALMEVFGTDNVLPAHQGRACENILAERFVKPGMVAIMNFHFTTTKAHVTRCGGEVVEVLHKKGLIPQSDDPFKGDMDLDELRRVIEQYGADKVAYVRVEAGTNLIGGQPVSLQNVKDTKAICKKYNIPLMIDASLITDNLYFNNHNHKYVIENINEYKDTLTTLISLNNRKINILNYLSNLLNVNTTQIEMFDYQQILSLLKLNIQPFVIELATSNEIIDELNAAKEEAERAN